MRQWTILIISTLALSACGDSIGADPAPEVTRTPDAPPATHSIIRPELEDPREIKLVPLETTIGFSGGGAQLDDAAKSALQGLIESPQYDAGGKIILRGHTDASGRDEVNIRASQARAEAVRDYLVKLGVDEGRFTIIAFGEQNPVAPNALPDGTPNEEGRAANRRVEVTIELPEALESEAGENTTSPDQGAEGS